MSHYRSEYRATARSALAAHPRFADVTIFRVWPDSVDDATLPVLGVLTPQEPCEADTQKTTTRRTLMQVALRRRGGEEIEDMLDEDSALIEAIIIAALRSPDLRCVLEETSIVTNSQGFAFVGTLVMGFRLQSWRPVASLT